MEEEAEEEKGKEIKGLFVFQELSRVFCLILCWLKVDAPSDQICSGQPGGHHLPYSCSIRAYYQCFSGKTDQLTVSVQQMLMKEKEGGRERGRKGRRQGVTVC